MKKLINLFLIAVIATAFASCSKDDEPGSYEPTYDGVSIYLNAVETLYDSEGKPAFTPTAKTGVYVAAAESQAVSANFIKNILENPDWDGRDVTVSLGENGESGSLKIVGATQALLTNGIYNEIIVDIKDYTPFTLQIITTQQAENGYGKDIVVVK